ncbi:hypothetical protein BJ878DRAFT_481589 [Calycina marina]|uniref:Uncharacterized protein n=1 Tax=Calycina marina TaxID=1763456 RepID=A0A9P8CDS0_9HELO|nr:hypothetical protein BJ878DRAFT_481589 [Calycina marina]
MCHVVRFRLRTAWSAIPRISSFPQTQTIAILPQLQRLAHMKSFSSSSTQCEKKQGSSWKKWLVDENSKTEQQIHKWNTEDKDSKEAMNFALRNLGWGETSISLINGFISILSISIMVSMIAGFVWVLDWIGLWPFNWPYRTATSKASDAKEKPNLTCVEVS